MLVERVNPDSSLTWWKLDGRKLQFRNDVRPAGKYVFYNFAAHLMRRNWSQRLGHEVLKVQWGFKGEYIPNHMLKSFVEETGVGYKWLINGAMESKIPFAVKNKKRHGGQELKSDDHYERGCWKI
jgi:hypothetical protein